ncbi:MAG: helix-turn-helix domain-containing protein [Bacteroidota bacterium]
MIKSDKKYQQAKECPITLFMNEIGGKWKPVILWLLQLHEVMRFNELNRAIHGISQKMLSQQLKDLERLQLIDRKSYHVIPPKVEYSLTPKGASLTPILQEILDWTNQNLIENTGEPCTRK